MCFLPGHVGSDINGVWGATEQKTGLSTGCRQPLDRRDVNIERLVQATSIMRTLQVGDRPTKLAQAVAEVGRIDKTIHILTSIDDEFKRRRTLTQLNRGEDRHSLARAVFHGKRGELRQRYREGQEDQLGALGLVVNILALWNTIYMDAVLEQLRIEGYALKPEDVARLSPLTFDHINFLGRYAFALPDSVAHGQLRPLRSPDAPEDE
jgi:Tn3 transposase DDE domain